MKRMGLFVVLLAITGYAYAENEAVYDFNTQTLNVPKVVVGNSYYEAELKLTNVSQDGKIDFTLTNLQEVQGASSIIGSWGTGYNISDPQEAAFMSLTFYPNGYYIHWESNKPSDDCDSEGVEYGRYTYDPATRLLTVSNVTDKNGCIGLAENGIPHPLLATVSGDSLVVCDGVNACLDDEARTLDRVK